MRRWLCPGENPWPGGATTKFFGFREYEAGVGAAMS